VQTPSLSMVMMLNHAGYHKESAVNQETAQGGRIYFRASLIRIHESSADKSFREVLPLSNSNFLLPDTCRHPIKRRRPSGYCLTLAALGPGIRRTSAIPSW
jgi:hypothetical protein